MLLFRETHCDPTRWCAHHFLRGSPSSLRSQDPSRPAVSSAKYSLRQAVDALSKHPLALGHFRSRIHAFSEQDADDLLVAASTLSNALLSVRELSSQFPAGTKNSEQANDAVASLINVCLEVQNTSKSQHQKVKKISGGTGKRWQSATFCCGVCLKKLNEGVHL